MVELENALHKTFAEEQARIREEHPHRNMRFDMNVAYFEGQRAECVWVREFPAQARSVVCFLHLARVCKYGSKS